MYYMHVGEAHACSGRKGFIRTGPHLFPKPDAAGWRWKAWVTNMVLYDAVVVLLLRTMHDTVYTDTNVPDREARSLKSD